MKKMIIYLICLSCFSAQAGNIYIRNLSSAPIDIKKASVVTHDGATREITIDISVQPGQTTQIRARTNGTSYTNFDMLELTYTTNEYRKTARIYFPADPHAETSFVFSNSNYDRYPYNIEDHS